MLDQQGVYPGAHSICNDGLGRVSSGVGGGLGVALAVVWTKQSLVLPIRDCIPCVGDFLPKDWETWGRLGRPREGLGGQEN